MAIYIQICELTSTEQVTPAFWNHHPCKKMALTVNSPAFIEVHMHHQMIILLTRFGGYVELAVHLKHDFKAQNTFSVVEP